jgi:hypothetical protein
LWAQIAWRIVEDNCGSGDAFEKSFRQSPAKPYAFVIEILCIAFHSIAHRDRNSIWDEIINGPAGAAIPLLYVSKNKAQAKSDVQEEQEDPCTTSESDLGTLDDSEEGCDSDIFNDSAYEGSTENGDEISGKQQVEASEPLIESGVAILVRLCDSSIQHLHMIDDTGEAITGYYARSKVIKN